MVRTTQNFDLLHKLYTSRKCVPKWNRRIHGKTGTMMTKQCFFWVSTKSHTQKTTSEAKLCGCHVLAAEKPQSRCGFGWSGGWFPWEIVVMWLRNVQIAKWRGRNPGAASSSICRIGSLLNLPAHAWEKHVLSLGAAWRSQAAMIVVFTIVIMHCYTIWCVSQNGLIPMK